MRKITRRGFVGLLGATALAPAAVADPFGQSGVVYAFRGRAIRGIDVVSYFSGGRVQKGADAMSTSWRGAVWCFATAENRATFEANPRAYAPKYGGYCAFAMSLNLTQEADPMAWRIRDGRLYLFTSQRARDLWDRDPDTRIATADGNWPAKRLELAG